MNMNSNDYQKIPEEDIEMVKGRMGNESVFNNIRNNTLLRPGYK